MKGAFWKKNFFKRRANILDRDLDFKSQITSLIGYKPVNINFFEECFTHTSIEEHSTKNFERLEFLGDSALGLIVSEYLYKKAPNEKEGYLTQMRSKIVNRENLNLIGEELKLESFLVKRKNTNLGKDINGNLYEALIGAIYLDKGLSTCYSFIKRTIFNRFSVEDIENKISSYKSLIVEWGQKNKKKIDFKTEEEHNAQEQNIFFSQIIVDDLVVAKGRDLSKKKAEEQASKRAYYTYNKLK